MIDVDPSTAKAVTFHKDVKLRSVTYDGDTYDPSGQLSGGSRPNTAGLILKMSELKSLNQEKHSLLKKIKTLEQELDQLQRTTQHYHGLVQTLELKEHALSLLQERFASNSNAQLIHHVEEMKKLLETENELIKIQNEKRTLAAQECRQIEKEMKEFTLDREAKLTNLQVCLV